MILELKNQVKLATMLKLLYLHPSQLRHSIPKSKCTRIGKAKTTPVGTTFHTPEKDNKAIHK